MWGMLEINNLLRHARQKIVSYVLPITVNVWNVKKAIIEMKFCFIVALNLFMKLIALKFHV